METNMRSFRIIRKVHLKRRKTLLHKWVYPWIRFKTTRNSKVLLAANFGRKKNSEAKKRKIAVEYVKLCGYKRGGNGSNQYAQKDPTGPIALTLSEIAKQLHTSTTNLKRMLRIDKNLTDPMS